MGRRDRTRRRERTQKKPMTKLMQTLGLAIRLAEEMFGEGTGEQKKQFVIDTVNKKIDIPLLPEQFEATLLGLLIDFIVDTYNDNDIFDLPALG
jgi:hypothetical protein